MALCRVTWDIMQINGPSLPVMFIVHIETEIKPIFISIQSICGLDVSSVHALKVQYKFALSRYEPSVCEPHL